MRSVEIRNGRLFYYGSAVGYLEGDGLTADPMFRREDLERWLERKNLPVRWVDGVYDRLANGESIQNAQPLKSLRIWQLKPDTPIEMRFIGLDRMAREFDGPNPSQYRIAYDGQAESQELEDIWNKFCRRTLPGGDHPLAISDVIELYDVDGSAFYYVDKREIVSVDFTPVIHENMNTPEPSRKDGSDQRLFQKLEQEYLAYLEPLRSAALSELLEKAGEIADTQAVYRCLCENTGLSTEQKEKLATLEQPLQAIRDRWRQTHPNPLWMFRPFLSPAPLPLEVISQLQEPMKALQMWLFFSLLLVGAIFDCQKRLIPNTLCALITMVGLLVFHPAQLMGPLAALPLLAAAMHKPGSIGGGDIKFTAASGFVLGITDGLWGMALGLALAALFYAINWSTQKFRRRKCAAPSQTALPLVPFLSFGFAIIYILNYGGTL